MADTFCGKNCAECNRKVVLKCPGCKAGPGKPYGGECTISRCCATRGHHDCGSCVNASTCPTLKGAAKMAENRYMKTANDQAQLHRLVEDGRVLSKWLNILFFLEMVSIILGVAFAILAGEPEGGPVTEFLGLPLLIAHALILFRISSTSHCFHLAGTFSLIYLAMDLVNGIMMYFGEDGWPFLILQIVSIVSLILSILAAYQEFVGYAEAMEQYDENLGRKWSSLWVLNFICLCGTAGSNVLCMIAPALGGLVLLLSALGSVIITIVKLIYIRDSAKICSRYVEEAQYFV